MDRRYALTITICSLIALVTAGCATSPSAIGTQFAIEEPTAEVSPVSVEPSRGSEATDSPMPDVSLASPWPRPGAHSRETAGTDPQRGRFTDTSVLTDEFHLSASTGWLVLPVPRITDDLPHQIAPTVVEMSAGHRLILPMLPAAAASGKAVATQSQSDRDPDLDSDPGSDPDRAPDPGRAPDLGPRLEVVTAPAPDRSSYLPEVDASPAGFDPGAIASGIPPGGSAPMVLGTEYSLRDESASLAIGPPASTPIPTATSVAPGGSSVAAVVDESTSSQPAGLPDSGTGTRRSVASGTEWSQRNASLRSGSDVSIRLPGGGWLYVGREYGAGDADLLLKRSVSGDDEFVFQFSDTGEYGLWFQREDATTGIITNERLQVAASPHGNDRVSVASVAGSDSWGLPPEESAGSTALPDETNAVANRVVGDLREMEEGSDTPGVDDDPAAWIVLAAEAAERGNAPRAVDFWRRIIAAGGSDGRLARSALFDFALSDPHAPTGSESTVLNIAVESLRAADELDREVLLAAADAAEAVELYSDAAGFLSELSEGSATVPGQDAVYYRLARLLSQTGPLRDLERSKRLFTLIIDDYPLSRYWDDSTMQVEYLDRHFFEVR